MYLKRLLLVATLTLLLVSTVAASIQPQSVRTVQSPLPAVAVAMVATPAAAATATTKSRATPAPAKSKPTSATHRPKVASASATVMPTPRPVTAAPTATAAAAAPQAKPLAAVRTRTRTTADAWSVTAVSGPAGTEVRDASGALLALFTYGSRSVSVAGPWRAFGEAGLATPVKTDRWVRLLPTPYAGFDASVRSWLAAKLIDRSPDVLAVASQYATGAALDARYVYGGDFNDYLGRAWTYGSTVDQPEAAEIGALDCSGFVRMVLGDRLGIPVSLGIVAGALPRSARDQLAGGPGIVLVGNTGVQVRALGVLRPGDLVYFDASTDDGALIDHVGIYVGRDTAGHYRFISSRRGADGPTIGDVKGASILDGSGYWASAFRAVRRP
jgi:cell wall-associated NlpC family hydrolase